MKYIVTISICIAIFLEVPDAGAQTPKTFFKAQSLVVTDNVKNKDIKLPSILKFNNGVIDAAEGFQIFSCENVHWVIPSGLVKTRTVKMYYPKEIKRVEALHHFVVCSCSETSERIFNCDMGYDEHGAFNCIEKCRHGKPKSDCHAVFFSLTLNGDVLFAHL